MHVLIRPRHQVLDELVQKIIEHDTEAAIELLGLLHGEDLVALNAKLARMRLERRAA